MTDVFSKLAAAKTAGKKIVGVYCAYAPIEIILAAGAMCFSLCASDESPIYEAEKILPRSLCPMVKASYGLAAQGQCPYFLNADMIIAETTCDGKKKMFELLQQLKPIHIMKLPQSYDDKSDKAYWLASVEKLKCALEAELDVQITENNLKNAIRMLNEERRLVQKLSDFMKLDRPPLTGLDMLRLIAGRNEMFERREYSSQLREMIKFFEGCYEAGQYAFSAGAKRILVTGVPTGPGVDKVIRIVEECGAAVVYIESCSGMKLFTTLVDETKPPLEAIAEKYLTIPCSCMSPNPLRFEQYGQILQDYRVDGVIDLIWQGCHTYNVESKLLQDYLRENFGTPFLKIESNYSPGDTEQIRMRVEAFLEILS